MGAAEMAAAAGEEHDATREVEELRDGSFGGCYVGRGIRG